MNPLFAFCMILTLASAEKIRSGADKCLVFRQDATGSPHIGADSLSVEPCHKVTPSQSEWVISPKGLQFGKENTINICVKNRNICLSYVHLKAELAIEAKMELISQLWYIDPINRGLGSVLNSFSGGMENCAFLKDGNLVLEQCNEGINKVRIV